VDDFLRAIEPLPDPCPEVDAAEAIAAVFKQRGHLFVMQEMEAIWESRWPEPEQETVPAAIPDFALHCQWCSGPIPVARGKKARYCSNSHRVTAHKARKRQQEREANEVPAGSR
jgi:hypothetical protein